MGCVPSRPKRSITAARSSGVSASNACRSARSSRSSRSGSWSSTSSQALTVSGYGQPSSVGNSGSVVRAIATSGCGVRPWLPRRTRSVNGRGVRGAAGVAGATPRRARRGRPTARSGGRPAPVRDGRGPELQVLEPGAGRAGLRAGAVGRSPDLGPREVQRVLGPPERDVQEPALLGELFGRGRPRDGHETLLEAGDEHDPPLESLGPVEGEEVDAAAGAAFPARREVEPRDEPGHAARAAVGLQVLAAQRAELGAVPRAAPRARRARARASPSVGGSARVGLVRITGAREIGEVLRERPARCPRSAVRSSSSSARTTGRSTKRPALGNRHGTPRRAHAASNRADWAFVRKSTAIWSQGTPSTNASQHPWATAAASASSSA